MDNSTNNINVEDVIKMLDRLTTDEVSRIKILMEETENAEPTAESADEAAAEPITQHHHGRCDIGSPWARGEAFDVLE